MLHSCHLGVSATGEDLVLAEPGLGDGRGEEVGGGAEGGLEGVEDLCGCRSGQSCGEGSRIRKETNGEVRRVDDDGRRAADAR